VNRESKLSNLRARGTINTAAAERNVSPATKPPGLLSPVSLPFRNYRRRTKARRNHAREIGYGFSLSERAACIRVWERSLETVQQRFTAPGRRRSYISARACVYTGHDVVVRNGIFRNAPGLWHADGNGGGGRSLLRV